MKDQIASTLSIFLEKIGYSLPIVSTEHTRRVREALNEDYIYFQDHPQFTGWFDRTCTVSVGLALMAYPECDYEVQVYVARYTVFTIYFDDMTHITPTTLGAFQKKLFLNDLNSDTMAAFRRLLVDAYHLWDGIPANSIVNSSMDFLTGCAMEADAGIQAMKVHEMAASWPEFLREKTGIASAYSFMVFPRSSPLPSYIQIIGDANRFIELTNDILSFYKEYLAGETQNYISNRAFVLGQSQLQTFQDAAEQVLRIHDRICSVLKGPELVAWKEFKNGYIAFHVIAKRYRLSEILPSGKCDIIELQ
ncbi:hypothetical protein VNI00_012421 [Paramarasmius palmivorus]|uniref:Terpene synthase n=1 Tax=Paramarasmius palmivorus TaxID=297713 RepID=A0AAW0C326_9AGAR